MVATLDLVVAVGDTFGVLAFFRSLRVWGPGLGEEREGVGSGWPQLYVFLFPGRVYFRSSRIFEVPPGLGTWAGGGEGWGTVVGSGWLQLSILLFRGGVYFRSSHIFEVLPGVGSWAGGGEGWGTGVGSGWLQLSVLLFPWGILSEFSRF